MNMDTVRDKGWEFFLFDDVTFLLGMKNLKQIERKVTRTFQTLYSVFFLLVPPLHTYMFTYSFEY